MNQSLALEIMLSGESVLLTGAAGSGKTYVLNKFIKTAKREGKTVAVTATTGLAATHLSGTTIHAWSGMGIHAVLPPRFIDSLAQSRKDLIESADVLVIDEISMLHDYRLDLVDEITRQVRGRDEPFGGLQIVLCGDFFQLPPINRDGEREGGFVVHAKSWHQLSPVICYLDEQHRQNDDSFLDILNAMRAGDVRRHHVERLLEQKDAELGYGQEVTELHTTNVDVDSLNSRKLAELKSESQHYAMQTTGKSNYLDTLKRSCLAVEDLELKEGALVMCIRNSPDKKYVNGSLGVVTGFEDETNYPRVELLDGRKITIEPATWELRDGDKKRASISQIPLRLAWAITVHKSQGMTLDAARIDLRRAFVEGMGYVALSRVRSLGTLSLVGINNMAIRVSSDAVQIDGVLRQQSHADEGRFSHLKASAAQRAVSVEENSKAQKPTTSWGERLAKMREEYPRAFTPWKQADDAELRRMYDAQMSVAQMSQTLGRQPGGVRARIKKFYGDDALLAHK
ncbi:AAA family ATPase [bacterium]|jgi:ATP-dependent DNA helicase PIF1|nr:MAG: AAA family ATPase [bacterium]